MVNLSEQEIKELKTIAYYAGSRFGDFPKFFKLIAENTENIDPTLHHLLTTEIEHLNSYKAQYTPLLTRYRDEDTFEEVFSSIVSQIINYFDPSIPLPNLYIVDSLPGIFADKPWDAMFSDAHEERTTQHPPGIYFKRQYLYHPFFECVSVHETIHWIISFYSKKYFPLTNLLEEGVCDFFRYYFLKELSIIPPHVITNYTIYCRILKKENSQSNKYYKFSNYITAIAQSKGVDYLFDTIKKGREYVNRLAFQEDIQNFSAHFINLNLPLAQATTILDPKSYLIFKHVTSNKIEKFNIQEICEIINLSESEVEAALKILVDEGYISGWESGFYQSFIEFPSNIKYSLDESN